MIRHFLSVQFLRFLCAGGIAALANWLSRMVLSQWLSFEWAVALAYGVGMTVAFLLNRVLVFPHSDRPVHQQLRDFVLVNLGSFPVVWACAIVFEAGLRQAGLRVYTEPIAHGIAIAMPMFAAFLIYKFVAFREGGRGRP